MAEITLRSATGGLSPSAQRAALVATAVFVLLAAVLYANVPSVLPGYPAIVVAFAAWLVLPGWALQRALVRSSSPTEQVLAAFLCSVAISAAPGLLALRWHWSLEQFGLAYALLAAAVSAAGVLLTPDEPPEDTPDEAASAPGKVALIALVAIPLLAIATSPWWGGDLIGRDADDWVYMTYVNEYQHEASLDANDVAAGGGAFDRMQANVWVVHEALLADSAGVAPYDALMSYLPAVLSVLAVGATFVLARGLFKNSVIALLAAGFHIGYAVLDLSAHEGFGRNVLVRITEDKMVSAFVLLPVAMLYAVSFVTRTQARHLALALLAGLALFVVHPAGVIYLAAPLGAFALFRAIIERSPRPLVAGAAVLIPLALLSLGTFKYISEDDGQAIAVYDPRLLFRQGLHIVDVGGGVSIANFHIIVHPLMLAALALAPVAWLLRRRDEGGQYVLATSAVVLFLLFVPPVTTQLGDRFSWNAVWRLPWIVPVALTLAAVTYEGVSRLTPRLRALESPRWQAFAPAVALVLVLAVGLVVLEQYARVDGGVYYARTSSTAVLPGSDGSITLGGIDRLFSRDWRLSTRSKNVIAFVRERVPPGSTVLADPSFATYLPGTAPDVNVYAPLGSGTYEQLTAQAQLYAGFVGRNDLVDRIGALGIDYVLVQTETPADAALRPPFVVYATAELTVVAGEPELVTPFSTPRWSFGPDATARIAADPFTVPADINPTNRRIQFDIPLSVPETLDTSGRVRLVVSYRDLAAGPEADSESAVTDVFVEPGLAQFLHRSPGTEFVAGTQYEIAVWRQGAAPEDTLPSEIYVGGLALRYWPTGYEQMPNAGTYLLQVPRE